MGYYKVTSGPSTPILTTAEAKNYLKIDTSADDTLISDMVDAATNYCENYLGQKFITQTIAEVFDKIPKPKIGDLFPTLFLTVHPVQSVTSITYTDTNELYEEGYVSLFTDNGMIGWFDNFSVTPDSGAAWATACFDSTFASGWSRTACSSICVRPGSASRHRISTSGPADCG